MFVIGVRNFECKSVQAKRLKLEHYLRSLLEIPKVRDSLELKTFLGTNPSLAKAVEVVVEEEEEEEEEKDDMQQEEEIGPIGVANVVTVLSVGEDAKEEDEKDQKQTHRHSRGAGGGSAAVLGGTPATGSAASPAEGPGGAAHAGFFSARYISMLVLEIAQLKADKAQLAARVEALERRL